MGSPDLDLEEAVDAEEVGDEVAEDLLRSARELMADIGIRRLRMDDVARHAGYGRATLYRRYATRDELVWAVIARELRATLGEIEAALAGIEGLEDRLVEAFAATIEAARDHPLLSRLMEIEPDLVLPHLTTHGEAALELGRQHTLGLLRRSREEGQLGPVDLDAAAELIIRVTHSLLLTEGGPIPLDDPAALRDFARHSLARPLSVLGQLAARGASGPGG